MKKADNSIIDINKTAISLGYKCLKLLTVHELTGCDSTSYPYGKGKVSALNVYRKVTDIPLHVFGDQEAKEEDIAKAGCKFFLKLYGAKRSQSMNQLRHELFSSKKSTPNIK